MQKESAAYPRKKYILSRYSKIKARKCLSPTTGYIFSRRTSPAEDRLNEEHEKAIALLDNRYDRMKADFARQDAIIAQIQSQMDALKMQIDMSIAKN